MLILLQSEGQIIQFYSKHIKWFSFNFTVNIQMVSGFYIAVGYARNND